MANIRVLQDITVYNSITAVSGITTNTLTVGGDATIQGNLTVTGSASFHNTDYTTTSAISVTNTGTGPALVVNQTGEQAIAALYDDNSIAFYVDGKTGSAGYVGIGTSTPNEKLTVVGNISSTGNLTVGSGPATLFVENGLVGVNTETPNEALTIIGNISASGNIYATNILTKFVSAFGDGSNTSYEISHMMNTEDVVVSILDTTTKEVVYPSVVNFSISSIKVEFSEAPALTAYKAVIIG